MQCLIKIGELCKNLSGVGAIFDWIVHVHLFSAELYIMVKNKAPVTTEALLSEAIYMIMYIFHTEHY